MRAAGTRRARSFDFAQDDTRERTAEALLAVSEPLRLLTLLPNPSSSFTP